MATFTNPPTGWECIREKKTRRTGQPQRGSFIHRSGNGFVLTTFDVYWGSDSRNREEFENFEDAIAAGNAWTDRGER